MVKIAIADQEQDFCNLLIRRLASERNMRVVGSAEDGWELLPLIQRCSPDILIMDLSLSNGLVLLPYIHRRKSTLQVLVLSDPVSEFPEPASPELGIYYYRKNKYQIEDLLQYLRDILGYLSAPSQSGPGRNESLETRITLLLREFGIPANIKGYQYLRKAIQMAVESPETMNAVTKAGGVERAIRNAIEVAWNRGNVECLQKYFGYTISPNVGRPTNSEFIATLADMLCLQEKQPESTA